MNDERIESRPLLGGENRSDGLFVQRIGPEPVNRFGGKTDQPSLAQELGALRDAVRIGGNNARRPLRCLYDHRNLQNMSFEKPCLSRML